MTAAGVALVAGATGLVGRAVCAALAAERASAVHALVRRDPAGLPEDVVTHVVDYDHLAPTDIPPAADVYCCLGTTRAEAGSDAAQRRVDYDYVLALARVARAAGARRFAFVSALGADPAARVSYSRLKGEAERDLQAIGFERLVIARPSFLAGAREALGQRARPMESLALAVLRPARNLLPRRLRPVAPEAVARALIATLRASEAGVVILESEELQDAAKEHA
jgi:uncharacterized protein YbjT (DUF2867 family)